MPDLPNTTRLKYQGRGTSVCVHNDFFQYTEDGKQTPDCQGFMEALISFWFGSDWANREFFDAPMSTVLREIRQGHHIGFNYMPRYVGHGAKLMVIALVELDRIIRMTKVSNADFRLSMNVFYIFEHGKWATRHYAPAQMWFTL